MVGIHRLRTRRIGHNIAIEVHTKMDGDKSLRHAHDVATEVERRVKERYGPDTHIGIHMEPAERPFAFRNALPGTLHKGRVAAYLFCDIVRGDLGAKTAFIETQHGLS